MGRSGVRLYLAAVVVLVPAAVPSAHADWPNFRGPNLDGISSETGLKIQWTGPIPRVWERQVGPAYSSFAAVGDRIYTCGTQDRHQVLFCLHADTGKILWQNPFAKEFPSDQGGGTRATPTVRDGRVYILGAHGRLLCADAATGEKIWSRSFDHKPKWGYSGSVLIDGDLAIVSAGGGSGALAAFDKTTGKPVWKCGEELPGYATPYPFTLDDRRYIVGFMAESVIIAHAEKGRQVSRIPWKTDWNVNAASPIYHDGHLFLTSGYETGSGLYKLRQEGDSLEADEVWKNRVLRCKFQSPILYDGRLYASDQRALQCVDFLTGERLWHAPRIKHGTLILADSHLLLLTENGQLQIAKPTRDGFKPITTTDILSDRCWTVSVLHRGRLYARNQERVVCVDLRP